MADKPAGSVYLDGGKSAFALILCHGRGKHPTWKVVEPLRTGVHEQLGYHTLSLQMPNDKKHWMKYADDFDKAYAIIKNGIHYLKNEKRIKTIYLMGHSMGSRMASAFMAENPDQPVKGLIVAGCRNNAGYPFSCIRSLKKSIEKSDIAVLDIWGSGDDKDVEAADDRKKLVSSRYRQIEISGANHKFDKYNDEFVSAVVAWLKVQK